MAIATTANADFVLIADDGVTEIPLMLAVERDQNGDPIEGMPKTISDILAASDQELEIAKRLHAMNAEDFSGGVGISYNDAPAVYTRTPGYGIPAGASTDVTVTATSNSGSPIVAMAEYGGNLFAAQRGTGSNQEARVIVSASGTGAFSNSLRLGANEYMRDLCVFGGYLWASSSDASAANGRMHRWDGASWTSTAAGTFGTNGRNKMKSVYWVTQDGQGAKRLVVVSSGQGHISYTLPNADPLLAASYVEGVKTGTEIGILSMASSRRHIYAGARDGLFDLDEQGNSPNLTSYTEDMLHAGNGVAAQYLDGYVYMSLGQGLDRVRVDSNGVLQENPGQCAPGWGTRAETKWRGQTTALAVDQGFLVNAIWSPSTGTPAIFWGKDRNTLQIDSPNPLIWYGPEVFSEDEIFITSMRVSSPNNIQNELRLWVAAQSTNQTDPPTLSHISLPIAGSPLDDLIALGPHRFADGAGSGTWQPYSRIELLPETLGDQASKKILFQHSIATRGLDATTGTELVFETRADPEPGSSTYTSSDEVTVSPSQDITPSAVVSGHAIWRRVSFLSPDGAATPAKVGVLDACRSNAWKIVPSFIVRTLPVEYGDGVLDLYNTDETNAGDRSPDAVTQMLLDLTQSDRTILRDPHDKRWEVKLEQVLDKNETLTGSTPYGKRVAARLEITVLSEAA